MTKPVVLAIMGPSASGKDTLAQELVRFLNKQRIWGYITDTSHLIVSDTTRPKRVGELPGYDYNFITAEEFTKRDTAHMYIDMYTGRNAGRMVRRNRNYAPRSTSGCSLLLV
jgi:guanylate kinase